MNTNTRQVGPQSAGPVYPLVTYPDTVLRRRMGQRSRPYDRLKNGEWAILVDTGGMAYQVPDCYDRALAMGNVFEQTFEKILQSAAYSDSLTRDHVERQRVCSSCEYRGPCSILRLLDSRRADWRGERCAIAYEMYRAVGKERGHLSPFFAESDPTSVLPVSHCTCANLELGETFL